jgi:hypothetical protein
MSKRINVALVALATASFLIMSPSEANAAPKKASVTVSATQMLFIPGGAPTGAQRAEASKQGVRVTFTVPEGTPEATINTQISQKLTAAKVARGVAPMLTSTVYGDCGWSSVTLSDAAGHYGAYYTARFALTMPANTYVMNEHVWDPLWYDFSDWRWTETGGLSGGTSWFDSFTFSVDDAGRGYSAELDGDVDVFNGYFVTTGAQVDNVWIG